MKKFSKLATTILSLLCVFTMVLSLTATAAASDTSPDEPIAPADTAGPAAKDVQTVASDDNTTDTAEPDAADGNVNALITHDLGSSYLYWAELVLDPHPAIHYDAWLKQYYLAFGLDTSSKLCLIYEQYQKAFQLESNLKLLAERNLVDTTIWNNPYGGEKTIGEMLSKSLKEKIRANKVLDAHEALLMIQQTPEYAKTEGLKELVDYSLATLEHLRDDVVEGMYLISVNSPYGMTSGSEKLPGDFPSELKNLTPGAAYEKVSLYLEVHPEWQVLNEIREIALQGPTSKTLSTFEAYDQTKLAELYQKLSETAAERWPSALQRAETELFVVPFPQGTVFQWNEKLTAIAEAIDNDLLPISMTMEGPNGEGIEAGFTYGKDA